MRRWLPKTAHRIFLALAIAVVLLACQSPWFNSSPPPSTLPSAVSNASSTPSPSKTSQTTQLDPSIERNSIKLRGTILFWIDEIIHLDEVKRTVERYQQIQPDVHIIFERISRQDLLKRFFPQYRAGLAPNLLLIDDDLMVRLIQANALLSLKIPPANLANIAPSALNRVTYKNQIYGLPGAIFTKALCYNKKRIQDNPLPRTLEDVIAQSNAGYSFGIPSGFQETFWGLQLFGGRLLDTKGRLVLEPTQWADWLSWLEIAKNSPNIILSVSYQAIIDSFTQGKIDYLVCNSSIIPELSQSLGADNLGVTTLPTQADQKAGPLLSTKNLAVPQNNSPTQNQIVLDFIQFATNEEQEKKRVISLRSFIPPNRNVQLNQKLFPIEAALINQSRSSVSIPLDFVNEAETVFGLGEKFYQKVMEGILSPQAGSEELLKVAKVALQQ
jgi:arabinogalactan oligomer/maltooligosaccharide transport system substrate-binding protein